VFTFEIMVIENLTNNSLGIISEIVLDIGKISLWLQALGILSALIIISIVINLILNKKRLKKLSSLNKKINNLEKKLDKVLKKS